MSEQRIPIRRALVSVYDKTGLTEFAMGLHEAGIAVVSTGSTAQHIVAAGVPVTAVEDLTGFPELLDGRLKTLHPSVHAAILADRRRSEHLDQLSERGIEPFDLVVVNLYPFTATVVAGAPPEECVEQIDIGGPAMLRAAAKNHASVAAIVDPARYGDVLEAVSVGGFTIDQRRRLAADVFTHTATYDVHVASWMGNVLAPTDDGSGFPAWIGGTWDRGAVLRYGENPHQRAALYISGFSPEGLATAAQLHGKAMSYNNYVDAEAAHRAAYDFDQPAVVIVKHANPCGCAVAASIEDAYENALAADPVSAYGGVVSLNRTVSPELAARLSEQYVEVLIAPEYEEEALAALRAKEALRILVDRERRGASPGDRDYRRVLGGFLVQDADAEVDDREGMRVVTGDHPDEPTWGDLLFAWRVVKHVASNAIVVAKGLQTLGIGGGQMSRVDAVRLALEKAAAYGHDLTGAVLASDAFFPFPDGPTIALDAGIGAIIQPGGSKRDDEVVETVDEAGAVMVFTSRRHFRH